MGLFGETVVWLVGLIIGIPVWVLELLGLHSQAFRLEEWALGHAHSFAAFETGINNRFDSFAADINQTFDEASGGAFTALQEGAFWVSGGLTRIGNIGDTLANWPDTVRGLMDDLVPTFEPPSAVQDAMDYDGIGSGVIEPLVQFIEGIVFLVNLLVSVIEFLLTVILLIPTPLFIPVGFIVSNIFHTLAAFVHALGTIYGAIGQTGGIEAMFALVAVFLIVISIYMVARSLVSLQPVRDPVGFVRGSFNGVMGVLVAITFFSYAFANIPSAAMMIGLGAAMLLMGKLERKARIGIYGMILLGIGVPALWLATWIGFLASVILAIPATWFALYWVITFLKFEAGPRLEAGEPVL